MSFERLLAPNTHKTSFFPKSRPIEASNSGAQEQSLAERRLTRARLQDRTLGVFVLHPRGTEERPMSDAYFDPQCMGG